MTDGEILNFMVNEAGQVYGFRRQSNAGTAYYWYQFNLQGDVVGIIDYTGSVVARYSYDAWGKQYAVTNGAGVAQPTSNSTFIGHVNPIRYRGYYYDTETGLYYCLSRYYDPVVGRFINGDGLIDNRSISTVNMFVYCANNPVNAIDRSGCMAEAVGALTGIGTTAAIFGGPIGWGVGIGCAVILVRFVAYEAYEAYQYNQWLYGGSTVSYISIGGAISNGMKNYGYGECIKATNEMVEELKKWENME